MPRLHPALLLFVAVVLVGCTGAGDAGTLRVTDLKDGDSFVASDGVEYRVGLVNTPELSECGGPQAADRTAELLADGFTAEPYSTDDHGRSVARIATSDGDLGILLATEGMADDRYLSDFRHEHPAYAAELDDAFARARDDQVGLWQTCWGDADVADAPTMPATAGPADRAGPTGDRTCHPAYVECLPVGPDLDCRDVGHAVRLTGPDDPYRLDGATTSRSDGVGCDTYEPWSPDRDHPYQR